ncbi:MAG: hypothetical protein J6Q42_02195 [Clostridia bacterium]|nr:hypothetical protein [Clostridia bacterium]
MTAINLPPIFEERMRRLLGKDYERFLQRWGQPLTQRGLRVNTLKCTAEQLKRQLPFSLQAVPFACDGYVTTAEFRAGSEPLHHAGAYYMQEPSAMSAVTVLSPKKGEGVLDLCAAPGGKSTQIAAALDGTGLLWTNEYVPARAKVWAQNLERCGVKNGVVSCGDTVRIAAALPGWFDAVLADVPCSGEGMFRKEPAALADWSEEAVAHCANRSAEILDNAAACVKKGGRLVLSTCTFAPEENEVAVLRFLQRHPDFTLEKIDISFGAPAFSKEALGAFIPEELQVFASTVDTTYCRRIFPWHGGEGHFIAKFCRSGEETISQTATKEQPSEALTLAKAVYEDCFTAPPRGSFAVFGDTVRLLPEEFPVVSGVAVLSAGVAVAKLCKGRVLRAEPCHAVFQAAKPEDCRRLISFEYDDPRVLAFLRGEEVAVDTPDGYTGVAVGGVMMGFGKTSKGRLKNHYPKGLRILRT